MKINKEILSLPPYISTAWENIVSLFTQANNLIVILKNGSKIAIPNLNSDILETIFSTHIKVLEKRIEPKTSISFGLPSLNNNMGLGSDNLENFAGAMQHNPEQKNAPNIPNEILNKIANITKLFSEEANIDIPEPKPDCNCLHCQIAKAMQIAKGINPENLDPVVADEDLKFRLWDIHEEGKELYSVTNPLNQNEHYSVFLGKPLGCTCGKKNCEHIKAVLNS